MLCISFLIINFINQQQYPMHTYQSTLQELNKTRRQLHNERKRHQSTLNQYQQLTKLCDSLKKQLQKQSSSLQNFRNSQKETQKKLVQTTTHYEDELKFIRSSLEEREKEIRSLQNTMKHCDYQVMRMRITTELQVYHREQTDQLTNQVHCITKEKNNLFVINKTLNDKILLLNKKIEQIKEQSIAEQEINFKKHSQQIIELYSQINQGKYRSQTQISKYNKEIKKLTQIIEKKQNVSNTNNVKQQRKNSHQPHMQQYNNKQIKQMQQQVEKNKQKVKEMKRQFNKSQEQLKRKLRECQDQLFLTRGQVINKQQQINSLKQALKQSKKKQNLKSVTVQQKIDKIKIQKDINLKNEQIQKEQTFLRQQLIISDKSFEKRKQKLQTKYQNKKYPNQQEMKIKLEEANTKIVSLLKEKIKLKMQLPQFKR